MGNNNSDLSQSEFRQDWRIFQTKGDVVTWENKRNPQRKVFQYRIRDDKPYTRQHLYNLRKNSSFLVNAHVLKPDGFSCTMDSSSNKIYVEAIRIRLSEVQDIPYPDIFHLYKHALNGYIELTDNVGFFSIDQQQIGINQEGIVKVWMSNQFQTDRLIGTRISESQMVRQLLNTLQRKINQQSCGRYPSLAWYIGNHEKITFREARDKFVQYIKQFNEGMVPDRLNCIFEHGGVNNIRSWIQSHENQYESKIVQVIDNNSKVQRNYNQPGRISEQQYARRQDQATIVQTRPFNKEERITSQKVIVENIKPVQPARPVLVKSGSQRIQPNRTDVRVSAPVQREVRAQPQRQVRVQPQREVRVEPQREVRVEPQRQVRVQPQRQVRVEPQVKRQVRVQPQRQIRVQPPVKRQVRVESQPQRQVRVEPKRQVRVQNPRQVRVEPQRQVRREPMMRSEVRPVEIRRTQDPRPETRPVQISQREVRSVDVARPAPAPVAFQRPAPVAEVRRPVEAPVAQRPIQVSQVRRQQNVQNANRPVSITVQPQATQPLNIQKTDSFTAPIARQESKGIVRPANPEPVLTHPPQVVESISFTRPVERTDTEKIMQNLQGKPITENNGDSLVTSVPGGFNEPKLQQQRVISQTYSIKQEQSGLSGPNVKQLKSSQTNWQLYKQQKAPQLSSIGRAVPQSFNYDEERKIDTQYGATQYKYQPVQTKYNTYESKGDSGSFHPSQDGKSSPQFLAFLSEIKSGGSNPHVQSQSYNVSSSPSYLTKNQQQLGTVSNQSKLLSQGQQTYSHESISGYGQVTNTKQAAYEPSYQYQPESKVTQTYTYSKYESNIDPQLQADLQRMK